MRQKSNYLISATILIILSLFLIGCSGTYSPAEKVVDYHKGNDGVEISLVAEDYLDVLYEKSFFTINLAVENLGAYNIIEDNQIIISLSYDPFYVKTKGLYDKDNEQKRLAEGIEKKDSSLVVKGIKLFGKSKYYPSGSDLFLSFPFFEIKEILGQREKPSTSLFASVCYPYQTILSNMVCIDLNVMGANLRDQVCTQEDLNLANQGAPLAITQIEVENQPAGVDVVEPTFTIHVRNNGSGIVLSPASTSDELERVCSFEELNKKDFNTIYVEALLSNSNVLECSPNPIKLFDDEGITRCPAKDEKLILGHHSFQAPLTVTLSYVYLSSISKDIEIKRLNVYGESLNSIEQGCSSYQVEEGGICRDKCEYCNDHPTADVCVRPLGSTLKNPPKFALGGFSCSCPLTGGKNSCEKLEPKGLCAPRGMFCSGLNYCCMPECDGSSDWIKAEKECLPKCASSTKCKTASKKCYLGDVDKAVIIGSGNYYCSLDNVQRNFGKDQAGCEYACKK